MNDKEQPKAVKPAPKAPAGAPVANGPDLGQGEMQAAFDEANAQGFFGVKVDPTPNDNYTVAGQLAGAPTPEAPAPKVSE